MAFDFDHPIDRRGTHANKYEAMAARTGVTAPDGIPMWVADMEFAAPEPVRERLAEAVRHGVFGYYGGDESWRAAVCGWMARRHGWAVEPDWLTVSPGVCAALSMVVQAFSAPGAGVVVFAPVYHAFGALIRANGRRVVESPLRQVQGRYEMDLEALGANLPADARIVFLCSPHNPGGTVWTAAELRAVAAFCAERDLILVSDEVWHDLVFEGARHVPTAVAAPDVADRLITCAAPSKTFNLAGGSVAEVIIADAALRRRYRAAADAGHAMSGNLFGMLAAEAAYDGGAPWLDALLAYLAVNRDVFAAGVAERAPGARVMPMASTYLAWTDFAGTGLDAADVMRRLQEAARIGVNSGPSFGTGGQGWARFNLACSRSVIDTALDRLGEAFSDLR
ncbi:MalY/PatB family protein [Rubrimonas cliftonensis]|uniref:cysteine-S-conjugate beta-lyase n=1 Tax=Rubrimonas cliftonensis TaxID=89524 RepID=A0A1H3VTH7_9RHOB|nr:MalY/PatB family protein [Rubrimonas cliftonensis]SDZ78069.1 cystathione beta-lyase [Rubrimonas cliftonensis]